MPPTTTPYLHITDGTTDLNLLDGTNYGLPRGIWAPRVAVRKRSTLGGRPYTTVVEEIPLNVRGATAAAAMANLAALSRLLDQAQNWYDDESEAPVLIKYQPHGSLLSAPLESLIFAGAAEGGELIQLPGGFNDVGMIFEISGVVLRFVRDGAWYGSQITATTDGLEHPVVLPATFASSAAHYSPVKVTLGAMFERDDLAQYDAGFLLIANDEDRLHLIDAYDLAAGPFTTDADAARLPEGDGVLVYTPVGTTEVESGGTTIVVQSVKRIGVVAALRNTSASTTFTVRAQVNGQSGRNAASTPPYVVDTSTTDPRIVFLGVALCEETLAIGVSLFVQASAAADTLVIDYLALIFLDDPTSRILALGPIDLTAYIEVAATETELIVDPRALTARSPRVRQVNPIIPAEQYAVPEYWKGDAFLLSKGTTIAALYCGRNATGDYWRASDDLGGGTYAGAITFARRPVYLVPE